MNFSNAASILANQGDHSPDKIKEATEMAIKGLDVLGLIQANAHIISKLIVSIYNDEVQA